MGVRLDIGFLVNILPFQKDKVVFVHVGGSNYAQDSAKKHGWKGLVMDPDPKEDSSTKQHYKGIKSVTVIALEKNNIQKDISAHLTKKPDVLLIGKGAEDLLPIIDIAQYRPAIICVEAQHLTKSEKTPLLDHLTALGYVCDGSSQILATSLTEAQIRKQYFTFAYDSARKEKKEKNLETISGPGATLDSTQGIRNGLHMIKENFNIKTMYDAGCGDFNWMKKVNLAGVKYIGADIVEPLIAENKERFAAENIIFESRDIVSDECPKVDIVMCRDVLNYQENQYIRTIIDRFKQSGSKYLLASTVYNSEVKRLNADKTTGFWSPVDLTKEPFFLPNPMILIPSDNSWNHMGLWNLEDIRFYDYELIQEIAPMPLKYKTFAEFQTSAEYKGYMSQGKT